MVERVKEEVGDDEGRRVEAKVWEDGFHGWLECKISTSFSVIP